RSQCRVAIMLPRVVQILSSTEHETMTVCINPLLDRLATVVFPQPQSDQHRSISRIFMDIVEPWWPSDVVHRSVAVQHSAVEPSERSVEVIDRNISPRHVELIREGGSANDLLSRRLGFRFPSRCMVDEGSICH